MAGCCLWYLMVATGNRSGVRAQKPLSDCKLLDNDERMNNNKTAWQHQHCPCYVQSCYISRGATVYSLADEVINIDKTESVFWAHCAILQAHTCGDWARGARTLICRPFCDMLTNIIMLSVKFIDKFIDS
jgi:hypothetical protein